MMIMMRIMAAVCRSCSDELSTLSVHVRVGAAGMVSYLLIPITIFSQLRARHETSLFFEVLIYFATSSRIKPHARNAL